MKKKTIIIISTVVFTIILLALLLFRIYLITLDKSGVYSMKDNNLFYFFMNYMPEITIVFTIIAIYMRKRWGLFFSVTASILSILSLLTEIIILIIRSMDITSKTPMPSACLPLMDIPVIIICIVLFIIKFKIYTLPKQISFK